MECTANKSSPEEALSRLQRIFPKVAHLEKQKTNRKSEMRNLRCAQYSRKWASQITNSTSSHKKIRNRFTIQFWFPSHFFLLVGKMYLSKFLLDLPAKGGNVLPSLISPLSRHLCGESSPSHRMSLKSSHLAFSISTAPCIRVWQSHHAFSFVR